MLNYSHVFKPFEKHFLEDQSLGKGWQAPCPNMKVAKRSPWKIPRSRLTRWMRKTRLSSRNKKKKFS
jgi:hypothetical protein